MSIVVPVHNAESTLARTVYHLLDLVPDITDRFEILVVDDASSDQTEEIAHELALQYPQVRAARHSTRKGQTAAVQTALTQSTGDVVFVQEEGSGVCCSEIQKLWEMRHDRRLVMARAEKPRKIPSPHLLDRVAGWGEQLRNGQATAPGGIQMIRREAVAELERLGADSEEVRVRHVSTSNPFLYSVPPTAATADSR
ncbi:MAG: glycosyltransferase family 2 protein [Planctomycetota bacterium]